MSMFLYTYEHSKSHVTTTDSLCHFKQKMKDESSRVELESLQRRLMDIQSNRNTVDIMRRDVSRPEQAVLKEIESRLRAAEAELTLTRQQLLDERSLATRLQSELASARESQEARAALDADLERAPAEGGTESSDSTLGQSQSPAATSASSALTRSLDTPQSLSAARSASALDSDAPQLRSKDTFRWIFLPSLARLSPLLRDRVRALYRTACRWEAQCQDLDKVVASLRRQLDVTRREAARELGRAAEREQLATKLLAEQRSRVDAAKEDSRQGSSAQSDEHQLLLRQIRDLLTTGEDAKGNTTGHLTPHVCYIRSILIYFNSCNPSFKVMPPFIN